MIAVKLNGIKFTLRGAYTAADAFVFINNRSAAAEAACRFYFNLSLRERLMCVAERLFAVYAAVRSRNLAGRVIIAFNFNIAFIKLNKITPVSADGKACIVMHKAVN